MSKSSNVLVVAAHPDDEILGCGGIIADHSDRGDTVNILILAEGATSRDEVRDPEKRKSEMADLRKAAESAASILGAQPPRFGGLPDNRMDSLPLLDVIKIVEKVGSETKPEIVYTHHGGDLNIDHRVINQAVVTAFRPMPRSIVRAIYGFETVSSSEWGALAGLQDFKPRRFVNIEAGLQRKLQAVDAYEIEMRPFPHARSREAVEALARSRGASAGVPSAEALSVILEVVR